jgi:hypothetical protein
MDWLLDILFQWIYRIQSVVCVAIDFIKEIFYVLSGIEKVNINGNETDLLSNFLLSDTVKNVFLYILLIAVIILVFFIILAIVKSEYESSGNKKSKTKILSNSGKSLLLFLLIPFILLSGIAMTNAIMSSINNSMNPYVMDMEGVQVTIGGEILVTSGHNAYIGDDLIRSEIEQKFLTGEYDYANIDLVGQYYDFGQIDILVGLAGSIVILVMFVMSAVSFIQRIFDIIFLYIISPVSISTIPIDEGTRFKAWKDMVIAKVLSAYGIILTMNLFFIIIPQIQAIVFFGNVYKDGFIRLLFIIGGAYAVTKANIVVAQLTGAQAGNNETQQLFANIRSGGNITKGMVAGGLAIAGGVAGSAIGGKTFLKGANPRKYNTPKTGFIGGVKTALNTNSLKQSGGALESKNIGDSAKLSDMSTGNLRAFIGGGIVGGTRNIKQKKQFKRQQSIESQNKLKEEIKKEIEDVEDNTKKN